MSALQELGKAFLIFALDGFIQSGKVAVEFL